MKNLESKFDNSSIRLEKEQVDVSGTKISYVGRVRLDLKGDTVHGEFSFTKYVYEPKKPVVKEWEYNTGLRQAKFVSNSKTSLDYRVKIMKRIGTLEDHEIEILNEMFGSVDTQIRERYKTFSHTDHD